MTTDAAPSPPYLFVYGTLMPDAGSALGRTERARLMREGRHLGTATITAALYDLGAYPALVLDGAEAGIVHGHVFQLATPAETLAWLDAYEGLADGDPAPAEYVRTVRAVSLADGSRVAAWVYAAPRDPAGRKRIPEGRWRA